MNNIMQDLATRFVREQRLWRHWTESDIEAWGRYVVEQCAHAIQDLVDQRVPASEYPQRLRELMGVESCD